MSTWVDCAKGTFCGPPTAEMVDFVKRLPKHSEYHFTNLPLSLAAYAPGAVGTAPHDIVKTFEQCIAVLRGETDPAKNPHGFTRRDALLLLIHVAGDIHQPLHVGKQYLDQQNRPVTPAADAEVDGVNVFENRGGNNYYFADQSYSLPSFEGKPRVASLHLFWDVLAVDDAFAARQVKTPDEFAAAAVAGKPAVVLPKGDVATWPQQLADMALPVARQAYEGVQAVERRTNTSRRGETYATWTITVPENYRSNAAATSDRQMVAAGYRMAALLQAIWP